ncbi:hypothetical protein Glove_519g46 [Diversispora epigaea]|uniref:Uncharacterized protein n=1 Tax=Diversispora epigaea TaxID=1348612 RepID=A0A397GF02_9GLOM|nr:hypothetical protein Glove_519g46 [Diversispora epigaea]
MPKQPPKWSDYVLNWNWIIIPTSSKKERYKNVLGKNRIQTSKNIIETPNDILNEIKLDFILSQKNNNGKRLSELTIDDNIVISVSSANKKVIKITNSTFEDNSDKSPTKSNLKENNTQLIEEITQELNAEIIQIEKDVKFLRNASNMFTINVRTQKTDLLVLRLLDVTEILHVEVFGSLYKLDKKYMVGDAKKLLMMDVCNLCRILVNNFDCLINDVKKVKSYSIQTIGDRLTLFAISLVNKKKYFAIELASCIIPFSFEAIRFNDDTGDLRKWIHLPDDNLILVTKREIDELFLNDT